MHIEVDYFTYLGSIVDKSREVGEDRMLRLDLDRIDAT